MVADYEPSAVYAEVARLRKKVKRQERLIYELRYLVCLLWKGGGYSSRWRINGEGKRKHINNGHGTSFGAVEFEDGRVDITGARLATVAERALNGPG
jgi:hypothetical protein